MVFYLSDCVYRPTTAVSSLRSLFFHSTETPRSSTSKLNLTDTSRPSTTKLSHTEASLCLPVIPEPLNTDSVAISLP